MIAKRRNFCYDLFVYINEVTAMKIAKYRKITVLLLAAVVLITALSACIAAPSNIQAGSSADAHSGGAGNEFNIRYELGDEFTDVFTVMPQKAHTGETVELKTAILYDADLHVYANGQEIGKTHYDSDEWGYSFIMPEKDVLITARFYTKDEIWGTGAFEESTLREKYPEYFDLPTTKGLEVYVWQIVGSSYSCGVMAGTNREKTLEELMNLKGAGINEMRAILSAYDIPKENIIIVPWQNPVSSYIGEYWTSEKDEDPDSVARRRQEYIDKLRHMLLDGVSAVTESTELPEDFAFSIVWGTYGISSYDSKTGKLVKTKDATDVSKYTCTVYLAEDQMAEAYRILLSDINIFQYPDRYDPFNAPGAEIRVASEPNQTIIISVTADGRTKTVTCSEVAFGASEYCEEARTFMRAENEIVALITSLPEWAAFPEYEFFYE